MTTCRTESATSLGPWPLPALLAWAAGWSSYALALSAGAAPALAWLAGLSGAAVSAGRCRGRWRRAIALAGFPLSALALGLGASLPAWAWLLALMPLLLIYPLRAWRDAPFFPTPAGALQGLDAVVATPRRALDVGCGVGHGLVAMRRLWPTCELHGVEWSLPLAAAAALRCRHSQVWRGDMWAASWAGFDLVYAFQRPENMARIFDKASRELAPGAWLVSLEFEVPGQLPVARLQDERRQPLWLYRPGADRAASTAAGTRR